MDNVITRKEHEEFARRIDEENKRQNRRIGLLEDTIGKMNALTVSVEKMAVSMENMLSELEKQGDRLAKLEREPAETHKQIKMIAITALISTVIGAAITAVIAIL